MAKETPSRKAQDNANEEQQHQREERRGSLWSRFRSLSQRGGMKNSKEQSDDVDNVGKGNDSNRKPLAKGAVIGDVVEKPIGEEKKEDSAPQLKEEDEVVDDGDKKPAARVKDAPKKKEPEVIVVPAVTLEGATYSKERMVEALKKLQPHLEPEPNSDESGELDSVYERNFVVKSADDAKAVVDMMRANVDDFSSEFKLLTIAAFRNACLRNKELSKEIMEAESSENVVGVKVMDIWNHQATKNLEHLASTVDGAEKRWFHATTAAFIVMEYLKFIWDHLQTEKKEQLVDKKNHLNALHEEHGLEWNQRSYLDDVKECGSAIGADAIVKACDTNKSRLITVMSSREYTSAPRYRPLGSTRAGPRSRHDIAPNAPFGARERIERAERARERIERAERARAQRRANDVRQNRLAAGMTTRAQRSDVAAGNSERPVEENGGMDNRDAAGPGRRAPNEAGNNLANDDRPLEDNENENPLVGIFHETAESGRNGAEGARANAARAEEARDAARAELRRAAADRASAARRLDDIESLFALLDPGDERVPRLWNVGLGGEELRRVENDDRAEDEDFSAVVARAAVPHVAERRRQVLESALRNNDADDAVAIARGLDLEEDELLWGPRLPARRRLMMARRAVRDGQLDTAAYAREEQAGFEFLAHMEALEINDHFDRVVRSARQPAVPRRTARRQTPAPFTPPTPPHLRELRELEEAAKLKPFSVSEGLELVAPSPDFDAEQIFFKRITACVGWAIHGLIFEFVDGTRMGTLLVNPGEKPMKLTDKNLSDRACVGWTDIEYGDYVVGMSGDKLADGVQQWFCYSLTVHFASGLSINYEANHEPWRGEPFSFDVPTTQPCFVHRISFRNDQKEDMLGIVTSIHLPMSRASFKHLPLKQQRAVEDVLEIGKKVDLQLEYGGRKPMGEDVWWLILGFLCGWELLPPSPNVKASKDGQRLFDLYARRNEYRQAS